MAEEKNKQTSVRECFALLLLTAVWAVMWVQPTILAPARGFSPWARFLRAISAGISERKGNTHTHTQLHISGYTGLIWMIKEFPSFNPPNTSKLIHRLVRWSSSMSEALC